MLNSSLMFLQCVVVLNIFALMVSQVDQSFVFFLGSIIKLIEVSSSWQIHGTFP